MTISPTQKKIVIGVVLIALALLIWLVARAVANNSTYSKLESAAAAQPFADNLSDPQRSSIECYRDSKSSTCLAIHYTVSANECRDIAALLGNTKQDDKGCVFTKDTRNYQGVDVTFTTGTALDKSYTLTVSIGRN